MLRKGQHFQWNEDAQEAFEILKKAITKSSPMKPLNYTSDSPAYLSVDSSNIAVEVILSQENEEKKRHPSSFASFTLSEPESRYSQAKLELFGLYKAIVSYRYYLYGFKNLISRCQLPQRSY